MDENRFIVVQNRSKLMKIILVSCLLSENRWKSSNYRFFFIEDQWKLLYCHSNSYKIDENCWTVVFSSTIDENRRTVVQNRSNSVHPSAQPGICNYFCAILPARALMATFPQFHNTVVCPGTPVGSWLLSTWDCVGLVFRMTVTTDINFSPGSQRSSHGLRIIGSAWPSRAHTAQSGPRADETRCEKVIC